MRMSSGAVLAVVLLCGVARADETAAVKMVEKYRGEIERDEKQPNRPVIGVDLRGSQVTDAGLKELKELKQLQWLALDGCRELTDAGLKELKELKQLTKLDLRRTQ